MAKKILFICSENRLRSKTAEDIFKKDSRFEVKSAGTNRNASVTVSKGLLEWADYVFVMRKKHRNIIQKRFPDLYKEKSIICLYIPDEYERMDPHLIEMLKERVERFFREVTI